MPGSIEKDFKEILQINYCRRTFIHEVSDIRTYLHEVRGEKKHAEFRTYGLKLISIYIS